MLQQTQVSRVVDYYARFLERFPTLADVGRADASHVMEAWAGLGYYNRARNLHRLAMTLSANGRDGTCSLPDDPELLVRLPGIGPYTAGAIASFAFERRAALVDTNVARVLRRVFAPRLHPATSRGQKAIWDIARQLLPRNGTHAWTHNQALMELGALVCTARVARCEVCPVRSVCRTGRHSHSTIV